MNISITARHLDLDPNIKEYIHKKFEKIKRHFDNIIDVKFILETEKKDHKVKVNIIASGTNFQAQESKQDWFAAIDEVYETIDRNILKYKEKHFNKKHLKEAVAKKKETDLI